ncbi:MAG: ParB/RepB/Spo0J family partition protein [Brevefilum sp.]
MKTASRIEIAHVDLRYEHTRIRHPRAVLRMADSLEQFGQLMPIVVAADKRFGHILIDGYLRVSALKRMKKDMVWALLCGKSEAEALIDLIGSMQGRTWDVYEQGSILRELHLHHQMSRRRIARHLGKDVSWVSRRLLIFETLDDDMMGLVRSGVISSWSAQRILMPLARANSDHARQLADALKKENISTRRLTRFFEHYKKANRKVRCNMVSDPHLFLKALDAGTADAHAKALAQGPEGIWIRNVQTLKSCLHELADAVPKVLYTGQSRQDRQALLAGIDDAGILWRQLRQSIEKAAHDQP